MNEEVTWQKIFYPSGSLKYEGFTIFNTNSKELLPSGQGVKYFENGKKHMEGNFGDDWFIEAGTEYYPNENIKFIGEYNKGPRTYYGPRYFVCGKLFKESGTIWYEGTFHFGRCGVGYPIFLKEKSFVNGTEFKADGSIKREYIEDKTIKIGNMKTEIEMEAIESQNNNGTSQELSEEVLENLDKMDKEAIESMVKRGYSREQAESQSNAFS